VLSYNSFIKIIKVITPHKVIPLSFMENPNENQEVEETSETSEVEGGQEADATDWKAKALEAEGKAKRYKTKLKKLEEGKAEPEAEKKPSEYKFSTGDKALLKSYKDIKGTDELALAENWIKKYGCEIEEMLEDEVFNAKLTKLREARAVKEATPEGTGRSSTTPANQVDYWSAKYAGGMPLNEVPREFRTEVLNAHIKADEEKSKFGR